MTVHRLSAVRTWLRSARSPRTALDNIVDAHRYVDGGHKRGNIVVTMP
jgi:hypothetical protein